MSASRAGAGAPRPRSETIFADSFVDLRLWRSRHFAERSAIKHAPPVLCALGPSASAPRAERTLLSLDVAAIVIDWPADARGLPFRKR